VGLKWAIVTIRKGSVLVRVHKSGDNLNSLNSWMWYHMQIRLKFGQTFNNTKKAKVLILYLWPNHFWKRPDFYNLSAKRPSSQPCLLAMWTKTQIGIRFEASSTIVPSLEWYVDKHVALNKLAIRVEVPSPSCYSKVLRLYEFCEHVSPVAWKP